MVVLRLLILNQQLWDLMNLHVPYLVPEAMFKICGTCSCKVEQLSLSPLAQAFHRACTAKAPFAQGAFCSFRKGQKYCWKGKAQKHTFEHFEFCAG
jgi:hypothetical protein